MSKAIIQWVENKIVCKKKEIIFMKIIVVADTHKNFEVYSDVVEKNPADYYIHLGDGVNEFADVAKSNPDKEFVFVKGECDFCNASSKQLLRMGKCRIFCSHGHEQNVTSGLDQIIDEAKSADCNILLYGHTHLYKTEKKDGIYVMNPGCLGSPRGKGSLSFGVLEISSDGQVKMNIVAY